MKAYFRKSSFVIVIMTVSFSKTNAQFQSKGIEAGIGLGAYVYEGDLTPNRFGSFKTTKPGIHFFGSIVVNANLSLRINLAIAKLKGDESKYSIPEYRQQRSFNFKTGLFELSALGVWDIRGNNYNREKGRLSPYIFSGAGLSFVKIRRDWSNMNTEIFDPESAVQVGLTIDAQKKLPRIIPFIPAGLGLRYEISDRFAISAETGYRFVFTDYLDGFSYSANPKRDDHYHSTTVGLIMKFGKGNSLACPKIKY
jgi:Domain of unknown function (DUF6089)